MQRPIIISIEGNIGTGKSTVLKYIENQFKKESNTNIVFLKEPVDIWESIKDEAGQTVIQKFYGDQRRYAFMFQVMAYISRLTMIREAIRNNPNANIIVVERSLNADKNIFVQMLHDDNKIDKMEYDIYNRWYTEFIDDYRVDGVIYMDTSPEICMNRVNERKRSGEEGIPLSYLERCRDYHTKWFGAIPERPDTSISYHVWSDNYMMSLLHINSDKTVDYTDDGDATAQQWYADIKTFIGNVLMKRTQVKPGCAIC
jgi:deoxyadenosine/deoxycytidine kinase